MHKHGFLAVIVTAALTLSFAALAGDWPAWHGDGYSIHYPPDWRVDPSHDYQALGPGKDIRGTAFLVSAQWTQGTNLSTDSYLAVETLPSAKSCTADLFLDDADQSGPQETTQHGIRWSVEHGSDAGAGNFYDETVYAVEDSRPCLAIRYFVHSTNIGNYDPGSVRAFDAAGLTATFERMRRSFRLVKR